MTSSAAVGDDGGGSASRATVTGGIEVVGTNAGGFIPGMAAYTVGTFLLAVIRHVLLFEPQYRSFGYFEGEPSFLLGSL